MLYFFMVFVTFAILIFVKYSKAATTRFLLLMLLGWLLSVIGLLLYIAKMNHYYYVANRYFNITRSLWRYLMLVNLSTSNAIRVINIGVLLFAFSLVCFSFKFTNVNKNCSTYYLIFSLPLIVQLVVYDPAIYKILYLYIFDRATPLLSFEQFLLFKKLIHSITFSINRLYVIIAISNLLIYFINKPKINFLKNYLLLVICCITPVTIIHTLMFSWAPKILTNVSTLTNYTSYLNLDAFIVKKEYSDLFQITVMILFSLIAVVLLRFNVIEYYFKQKDIHISRSVNTANMGINVFSHMIKNRLVCILSEAEEIIYCESSGDFAKDKAAEIINTCHDSINNLNILSARFKKIKLDLKPTILSDPIGKSLISLHFVPPTIKLVTQYTENPPVCFIDERYMVEVITNIVHNALEAIPNNTGTITIGIERQENWGVIFISDTGCGISEENMKDIFHPFFSTKPSSKNWGLGLSYCYNIVSFHDGKLIVNSTVGHGTTFRILIPAIT